MEWLIVSSLGHRFLVAVNFHDPWLQAFRQRWFSSKPQEQGEELGLNGVFCGLFTLNLSGKKGNVVEKSPKRERYKEGKKRESKVENQRETAAEDALGCWVKRQKSKKTECNKEQVGGGSPVCVYVLVSRYVDRILDCLSCKGPLGDHLCSSLLFYMSYPWDPEKHKMPELLMRPVHQDWGSCLWGQGSVGGALFSVCSHLCFQPGISPSLSGKSYLGPATFWQCYVN